ncbi:MAG: hypothetical protein MUO72_08595 [Bacteroidales bacterium]|nr:hypothetical protein [Bacteroidales bacterium]
MSIGIIISLASIGVGILYLLINLTSDIISRRNKRTWISTVPKTRLIQEIIWFSNDLLYQKQIKYFPTIKISYYKHKRYLGLFDNKKIVIYIKNNIDIQTIVHTTLHELQHYVQSQSNLVDYKRYEAYSKSLGYDNNPLEVECREFANKWLEPCMTFLQSKGVITKEPLKKRILKKSKIIR